MSDENPMITKIATLECPWCKARFEGKLLCFDMAFMGRTVNLAADPLCPACRQLAEQKRAAEEAARQRQREAEWLRICPPCIASPPKRTVKRTLTISGGGSRSWTT